MCLCLKVLPLWALSLKALLVFPVWRIESDYHNGMPSSLLVVLKLSLNKFHVGQFFFFFLFFLKMWDPWREKPNLEIFTALHRSIGHRAMEPGEDLAFCLLPLP